MNNIVICRLRFPNDPSGNTRPHQFYVDQIDSHHLLLYSVSSIAGKERRVFGPNSSDYFLIEEPESSYEGFKKPSFINCTTAFDVNISSLNVEGLKSREISGKMVSQLIKKIQQIRQQGRLNIYPVSEQSFARLNKEVTWL